MERSLFSWACKEIANAETQLGHELGWRFLTTPAKTFSKQSRIAFMGLNPGGNRMRKDHAKESCENGPAHLCEDWERSVIQRQVIALFQAIAQELGADDHERLMNRSLMAYFIPFRSPSMQSLKNPAATKRFAEALWSNILPELSPDLIITLGWDTFRPIARILRTAPGLSFHSGDEFSTGWGDVRAGIHFYTRNGSKPVALARLPHLSRFSIFGRETSAEYVTTIVREMTKHMEPIGQKKGASSPKTA